MPTKHLSATRNGKDTDLKNKKSGLYPLTDISRSKSRGLLDKTANLFAIRPKRHANNLSWAN